MVAGVLLGPSLFGLLAPDVQALIFPKDSLKVLFVVAQFGIGLYMFLVGVEFKTDLFRRRVRGALSVSLAGMLTPFVLGAALALWLVRMPGFFSEQATALEAVLFLAAAMSITAFPMLARIIYERGLTGTALGTLTLAAGSIDDAAAWCVLAIVLASFGGGAWVAVKAIAGGILYTVVVLTVGRRLLQPLEIFGAPRRPAHAHHRTGHRADALPAGRLGHRRHRHPRRLRRVPAPGVAMPRGQLTRS